MGKSSFFKDFKAFITKGNIIDMAVGVIIGGAFGKIVSSLVADIITPLISLALGKTDFTEIVWTLREATEDSEAIVMNGGTFIQTVIDFLIIALCIFIVLRIAVKAKQKADALLRREKEAEKEAEEAAPPAPTPEQESAAMLKEIRDLLPELSVYPDALFGSPALSKKEKLKYHIYRPIIQLNLQHLGAFLMKHLSGHG